MSEDVNPSVCNKISKIERVLVRKINRVFKDQYIELVEHTVQRCNCIFETASFFLKLYLIHFFNDALKQSNNNLKFACNEFSSKFTLEEDFFSSVFTIVSSDPNSKKGPPFKGDKKEIIDDMYSYFDDLSKKNICIKKQIGTNLSHIFKYMKTQLKTAYLNNIQMHFPSYIKRLLSYKMRIVLLKNHKVEEWRKLDVDIRTQFNKEFNYCTKIIIFNEEIDENCDIYQKWKSVLDFFSDFPLKDLCLKLKTHPHIFLPYMIFINQQFETYEIKQLSPLPIRTEFTPKSIMFDKSALIDIFINDTISKESLIDHLKSYGWIIPEKFEKSNFYNSPNHLDHINNVVDKVAIFHTDVWKYFTKENIHKGYNELVFGNMISTNGYQCSVHYVDKESYKIQRFQKGNKICRDKMDKMDKKEEFEYVHKLSSSKREQLLSRNIIRVYNDPGKGNILTLGTGGKKGVKMRYTARQRKFETGFYKNREERKYLYSTQSPQEGKSYKLILEMLKSSAKSTNEETFMKYLFERESISNILKPFFSRTSFRRSRYRTRVMTESSEDKLKHTIKKKFNPDGDKEMVIFWGNWGRNPNLKNQPPTPGIGLRRRIHKFVKTITTDERGTSSACSNCRSSVEHPLQREYEKEDCYTGEKKKIIENVHHVLRCKNENCRMWWNRDVMGMNNIKKQSLFCLKNGRMDDFFTKIRKKKEKIVSKKTEKPLQQRSGGSM